MYKSSSRIPWPKESIEHVLYELLVHSALYERQIPCIYAQYQRGGWHLIPETAP